MLMLAGLVVAAVGAVVYFAPAVPWLGRLPGDVRIERPGLRLYFPVVTCVVISVVLTLVFNLISRLR
jgi:hypothetical protein